MFSQNPQGRNPGVARRSFSPDDPAPSARGATKNLPEALRTAGPSSLRYRLRLQWADPTARSRRREEIVYHNDPRKLLRLLESIAAKPDRPLLAHTIEVIVQPRWTEVGLVYLQWRSLQRDRRDVLKNAQKGGAR